MLRKLLNLMMLAGVLVCGYVVGTLHPAKPAIAQETKKGYAVYNFPLSGDADASKMQTSLNDAPITKGYRFIDAVGVGSDHVVVIFETPFAVAPQK